MPRDACSIFRTDVPAVFGMCRNKIGGPGVMGATARFRDAESLRTRRERRLIGASGGNAKKLLIVIRSSCTPILSDCLRVEVRQETPARVTDSASRAAAAEARIGS